MKDKIRCPSCGELIPCTWINEMIGLPFRAIGCPYCFEPSKGIISSLLLAVFYRGKWRTPDYFLRKRNTNGLILARSRRDKITAYLIIREAMLKDDEALSPSSVFHKITRTKILWVNGEAVGCYTYTIGGGWKIPTMHIIVVRRKFRRKGYGTMMIKDFLSSFKGKVGFEAPNWVVCRIIEKLGEVNRVVIFSSGL